MRVPCGRPYNRMYPTLYPFFSLICFSHNFKNALPVEEGAYGIVSSLIVDAQSRFPIEEMQCIRIEVEIVNFVDSVFIVSGL